MKHGEQISFWLPDHLPKLTTYTSSKTLLCIILLFAIFFFATFSVQMTKNYLWPKIILCFLFILLCIINYMFPKKMWCQACAQARAPADIWLSLSLLIISILSISISRFHLTNKTVKLSGTHVLAQITSTWIRDNNNARCIRWWGCSFF